MLSFPGQNHQGGGNNLISVGSQAYYWSSSPNGIYFEDAHYVTINDISIKSQFSRRAHGMSVRCFKNSYVPRPKILNLVFMSDGEEV